MPLGGHNVPFILSISELRKNAFPMDWRKCEARQCRCESVGDLVDGGGMGEATEAEHGELL